jgi:hypothetical protein
MAQCLLARGDRHSLEPTYRVSDLNPEVIATVAAVVMTHTSDPRELAVLAHVAGAEADAAVRGVVHRAKYRDVPSPPSGRSSSHARGGGGERPRERSARSWTASRAHQPTR